MNDHNDLELKPGTLIIGPEDFVFILEGRGKAIADHWCSYIELLRNGWVSVRSNSYLPIHWRTDKTYE